ncbi:MAG: acetyl-CoA carboxylase biotin carboxyl carrier protein [Acidobacteria bacterium]|nr:MAG: acetyl-CoA carboxylase biotin carboxyl carrier protein [Acidobacteriota bacterium]
MDVKEIKEILRILEEQDITEFELEQDGVKLRIARSGRNTSPPPAPLVASSSFVAPASPGSATLPPAPARPGAPAAPAEEAGDSMEGVVKSPIVGTFYRSADPNSPPFVNVGDRVRVGQVLCIIEAMKLMNEIESEVAGEVVKIHPENGQPVQYGDPLFTIRPA